MKAVFIALNRCASGGVTERGVATLFNVPIEDVSVEEFTISVSEKSPFQRLASIYSGAGCRYDFQSVQFITVRGVDQIAPKFERKHLKDIDLAVTGNSTMLSGKKNTLNIIRSRLRYINIIDDTAENAADEKDITNVRAWLAEITPSYKILHCPKNPFTKIDDNQ